MVTYVAKSLDDVFAEVRLLINDIGLDGANYRYTDDQVMSKFNTALRELYRYRTDAWIGNFTQGVITNSAAPMPMYNAAADLGLTPATVLPFDDRLFFNAVVFFMVGTLELGDDEFTDQGRATQLLSSFKQMLCGDGG
jgi:hypothetical protein